MSEHKLDAWMLANKYPEVLRAHAEFGGSDPLEEWLRNYHTAVLAERAKFDKQIDGEVVR